MCKLAVIFSRHARLRFLSPSLAFSLFILLALHTTVIILFQLLSQHAIHRFCYVKMMGVGSWGGFRSCLHVPQMASTNGERTVPPPLRLLMNYICSSSKCVLPSSFLLFPEQRWPWISSCLFLLVSQLDPRVFIFLTLYLCDWIRRTLQTVGPSHARTYTVAVYFKGERIGCGKGPRWVRHCNAIRHNRTWCFPSQCTVNGLEKNGCALLMVFIVAIKLLLAYSKRRNILQNENDSICYWFDINCLMEITFCTSVRATVQRDGGVRVCARLTAHLGACSYVHTGVKKVNLWAKAFSGLEGLKIKLQLSLREMKPKSIRHLLVYPPPLPPPPPGPLLVWKSPPWPPTWKHSLLL